MILIISPPGDLQIGLQALLTTHLDVDVLVTGKESSALKFIENHKPSLVIFDQDIQKDMEPGVVQQTKSKWPRIQCIVLVNDEKGREYFTGIGPDRIITKGLPGSKLIEEIRKAMEEDTDLVS